LLKSFVNSAKLLQPAAFAAKRKADELGLAVPDRFEVNDRLDS
jgi:hypothetical protein